MTPITFTGCFGWLHETPGEAACETAVLLCPALGHDARCAHRSLRLLADQLAMAGYPTMRFDYPGTGDSCDPREGEHWGAWQQSIHAAADTLRDVTGARRIVLCGVRVGALLATLVAGRRDDVAGLMLLAPVIIGRTYARELTAAARLRENAATTDDGSVEVDGLRLPEATLRVISQVDLRKAQIGRIAHILICAPPGSAALDSSVQNWIARGANVVRSGFDSLQALTRNTYITDGPDADFSTILNWLHTAILQRRTAPAYTPPPRAPAALRPARCIETPLRFGENERLFRDPLPTARRKRSGSCRGDRQYRRGSASWLRPVLGRTRARSRDGRHRVVAHGLRRFGRQRPASRGPARRALQCRGGNTCLCHRSGTGHCRGARCARKSRVSAVRSTGFVFRRISRPSRGPVR